METSDRSLHSELKEHIEQRVRIENGNDVGEDEDVNEEIERRLEALGYK
jgi:arylsulfatase